MGAAMLKYRTGHTCGLLVNIAASRAYWISLAQRSASANLLPCGAPDPWQCEYSTDCSLNFTILGEQFKIIPQDDQMPGAQDAIQFANPAANLSLPRQPLRQRRQPHLRHRQPRVHRPPCQLAQLRLRHRYRRKERMRCGSQRGLTPRDIVDSCFGHAVLPTSDGPEGVRSSAGS